MNRTRRCQPKDKHERGLCKSHVGYSSNYSSSQPTALVLLGASVEPYLFSQRSIRKLNRIVEKSSACLCLRLICLFSFAA